MAGAMLRVWEDVSSFDSVEDAFRAAPAGPASRRESASVVDAFAIVAESV